MYKVIEISEIVGSVYQYKPKVKKIESSEMINIFSEISNRDSFVTIHKSGRSILHFAELAEIDVKGSIYPISIKQNEQIKNRFVREYYSLDSEMQEILEQVIKKIYE